MSDLDVKPVAAEPAKVVRIEDSPRLRRAATAADVLPAEVPMAMPLQSWSESPALRERLLTSPHRLELRRALLIGATGVLALLGAGEVISAAASGGFSAAEIMLVALFTVLFAWIGFGFVGAAIGFVRLMVGARDQDFALEATDRRPAGRHAILMPIYNEDVDAVFGRASAMARSIAEAGDAAAFDLFVLSDSSVANGVIERAAFARLRDALPIAAYYRRRPVNHERKPGNIAEWLRRFGGAYETMLVLDADSLMSGETIGRMAATMERQPSLGLIQTVPAVIGARTGFARWQQFAARLYGPITTAGLLWWSGSEASFWGHNAIIRTRAFAESCGLPRLSGPEPFGGTIMSHDMLEAALLRRRGWAVHMVVADGSYEEYPPSLIDHAQRDRRWCQGNLQHFRLLDAAGFHWVSRLQLLMGGSAYLTSPLWLLLLTASLAQHFLGSGQSALGIIAPSGWLLGLTVALLFGPKLLAVIWALSDARRREGLGGTSGILASAVIELPLSMLVAPMVMLTQTLTLIDIARGRPSGWPTQRRDVDGMPLGVATRAYRWHLALGAVFAGLAIAAGGPLAWMAPVAAGLLLAPVIAAATSKRAVGDELARIGLFLVPEEHVAVDPHVRLRRDAVRAVAG